MFTRTTIAFGSHPVMLVVRRLNALEQMTTAPSRNEVIGWAFAGPTCGFVLFGGLSAVGNISKFEKMFLSLGATLPPLTNIALALGDAGCLAILLVLTAAPLLTLACVRNDKAKLWVPIVCFLLTGLFLKLYLIAVYGPIIELQKQLS